MERKWQSEAGAPGGGEGPWSTFLPEKPSDGVR